MEPSSPLSCAGKAVKVSHSLPADVVERLKALAYWERVSESSVIEFLLREFLSLGDNATLGTIVRQSINRRKGERFHRPSDDEGTPEMELPDRLRAARRSFAEAVDMWRTETSLPNFNRVSRARLELALVRAKVDAAGLDAAVETL